MNIDTNKLNKIFYKYIGKTASEDNILRIAAAGKPKTFKKVNSFWEPDSFDRH